MKLELNLNKDDDLRNYIKSLIREQVKSVVREEIKQIVEGVAISKIPQLSESDIETTIKKCIKEEVDRVLKINHYGDSFIQKEARVCIQNNIKQFFKEPKMG